MRNRRALILVLFCCIASISAENRVSPNERERSLPVEFALVGIFPDAVSWEPSFDYASVRLRVKGPDGFLSETSFGPTDSPYFEVDRSLPDGTYVYELSIAPRLTGRLRSELETARGEGSEVGLLNRLREAGEIAPPSQSGAFTIMDGGILAQDLTETGDGLIVPGAIDYATTPGGYTGPMYDQVFADDLIAQRSLCVGFDCVNGENFGFDTIRLKENNTRIKFEDTSTGTFATHDWQLTANDSVSGGQEKFSIEDVTAAKVPFTIEGDATTNSIYVDSSGKVGFRTNTPVLDLHTRTGNTPSLRLEQDGSSGFSPQTWDIAGNEANFFIRDVTGGSLLPFRIRPGAPTSSIDIAANGNVGIGIASPERLLHLKGNNAVFRMDRDVNSAAFMLVRTEGSSPWKTFVLGVDASGPNNGELVINDLGVAVSGGGARRMTINNAGNAVFTGSVTASSFVQASSLQLKTNVHTFEDPFKTVSQLRGVRFNWKADGSPAVGVIAEEVARVLPEIVAFEPDGHATGVNYDSLVAVLLEATKAQQQQIESQKQTIDRQQEKIARLESRLAKIEASLGRE